jgi:two-component system, NtrC family, response regulator AtoC
MWMVRSVQSLAHCEGSKRSPVGKRIIPEETPKNLLIICRYFHYDRLETTHFGQQRANDCSRPFSSLWRTMPINLHQGVQIAPLELPSEAVIFGRTPAMCEVRGKIGRLLDTDFPVLLQGERGTGKDLVARFLHARSNRREAPFVKLSCAATPQRLLEGELLGSEGAMAGGTDEAKTGLVEIADGGTLFLDEIAEMGLALQKKLLHLLRDGHYFRVGSREERRANVRIVCATNIKLAAAVKRGTFRRDLFNQIEMMCFRLSALRERKEDIPQLWDFFAQKLARKFGKSAPKLTPAILHILEQWSWPGNLCELESCIARVVILGNGEALGEELRRQAARASAAESQLEKNGRTRGVPRQAAAEAMILQALQANHWNQRKTTEELKRSYRSLLYRLRKSGVLQRPRSRKAFPRSD